jgi:hypothetical protein
MSNSTMPNLPGFNALADTMELMRNMWGGKSVPGMGIPGMVMPTLSVEDINKQVSDLKAVEAWLTLNMNMLRGTIQALEVQSATLTALKSMGESMSASLKSAHSDNKPVATKFPFTFGASNESQSGSSNPYTSTSAAAKPFFSTATESTSQETADQAKHSATKIHEQQSVDENPATPLTNPAVWWNMLQNQFMQVVSQAMTPEKKADATSADTLPVRDAVSEPVQNKSDVSKKDNAKTDNAKTDNTEKTNEADADNSAAVVSANHHAETGKMKADQAVSDSVAPTDINTQKSPKMAATKVSQSAKKAASKEATPASNKSPHEKS